MAISYVGGVQGGRAGSTSTTTQSLSGTLSGGSNTSPSAGDLVVVLCAAGADTTAAPSQDISGNNNGAYDGLTAQSSVVATTYDSYHRVSYKIQGGTVDTSITIPSSGSARNAQRWVVHVFRGVDSTTPMDVTATYATGTGTGRPNPAAIEPTTAGAWICAFYASAAGTGAAYTAPTDFATDWLGGTTSDTADCMTGGGYYTGWTSGSYDPAAITAGGTTNAADTWTATTIALRPAPPDPLSINKSESVTVSESDEAILDSYSEANQNSNADLASDVDQFHGQTFTGDGKYITKARFYLKKNGSPTGNATVYLYNHTGTFGSTGTPTGAALATSNTYNVASLTTSYQLIEFTFSTPYLTTNGTNYCIAIGYAGGGIPDTVSVGIDSTSPTHSGNGFLSSNNGSTWSSSSSDRIFYVYSANKNPTVSIETPTGDPTINKSESVTLTESASLLIPELNINKSESVTITESVQRLTENRINVSDSTTLTENVQRDTTNRIQVSDSSTLTEALQREVTNFIAETENITVTDTPQVTILERFINVSDSSTVTDVDTVTIEVAGDYSVSVSDTTTLTENVQRLVENRIFAFDTTVLTDSPTVSVQPTTTPNITVSDTATITENRVVLIPELLINKSENVTVTESVSLLIPFLNINKSETSTVTENVAAYITELFIQETENVSITENVIVSSGNQAFYNVITSENVTVTESVSAQASAVLLSESETATVSESVSVSIQATQTPTISVSDTTNTSENATIEPAQVAINTNDTATLSETTNVSVPTTTWTINVSDTISGNNTARRYYIDSNGNIYWVISEAIGLVEKI